MMKRSWGPSLVLLTALAACSDDEPATPNAACEITERVRIAAPPADWTADATADYDLHVFGDLVLYTFDDRHDPERLYHRLDRCTGESAPFPSLTPDLNEPYVVDTAAGRVLYASKSDTYYIVDRLDVPGDDTPQKLADLPGAGWLDFNFCNILAELPYACFWRDRDFYTHAGDPEAPALKVASDTIAVATYRDAILSADHGGDLRRGDPLTGASELLLTGAQFIDIIDPGPLLHPGPYFATLPILDPAATWRDATVLWQPAGETTLYLRRLTDGRDIPLAVDPAILSDGRSAWLLADATVVFTGPDHDHIVAAARADTGAALVVPEHVAFTNEILDTLSLTLPAPGTRVQAIWDPQTGALHPWYRSPDRSPELYAFNGESVDYFETDPNDPSLSSLWRVDLASGERRQLAPRVASPQPVQQTTLLLRFGPAPAPSVLRYDLEYVDLETSQYTPIAGLVASDAVVPGEGVLYLDADGEQPGIWAAPLP